MSNNYLQVDFSNKERCRCGKQATKLCDIVVGGIHCVGHPPSVDGVISNFQMLQKITCDTPICDSCAIHLNEFMDICPECIESIQKRIKHS